MLADAKLPVTFWVEAVNTACYVQNRVLVNNSQNKTPYELFNGRTPAIGFLKPFGCHVMILNTLDNLGKFKAKGDEGYSIGYSMSSKAFMVFNKRTKRVEENLHVKFLENKAIKKGVGPNWLFDIDSLTKSINYVPVNAGINSTNLSGIKDAASQEVKKDVSSLRYIVLLNWVHDALALLESSSSKPQDDCSTNVPESSENSNPTVTSTNPLADQLETVTVETPIPTKKDVIFLSQDKYVEDILKKFGYSYVRSSNTLMDKENPWAKDRTGKDLDLHLYRFMVGSLMYLTASRPDIMFVVCAYARHQVTPKKCHLHAVKRIFRYPKGHPKLGLWYPKESPFDLVAYSDSDYGGATQDRKSTTRGCQFLGRRLISWQCKKQIIVATSTTEAEYVAAASCCRQVLWIQNQLLDYVYNFMNTKIYIDNNSAICIVKNTVYHSKTKHIEIRHHFIKDCFEKKLISEDHIHIDENVADLLTKPFDAGRFQYLVCKRFPLLGKLSIVSVFLGFGLTFADSEQRTYEFIHIYLASASVYVWIGYALTFKPIVYVSHIRQFWSTARIETTKEGTKILATIDGNLRTVSESSIRRARIAQSSALPPVADEPTSPLRDVSESEACPTDSGFEADRDRANIDKTSTLPHESTSRVTSLAADEGSMQHKLDELTTLCTSLQRQHSEMVARFEAQGLKIESLKARIKVLKDKDRGFAEQSGDDAPIKRRRLDVREEATKRVSDDTEEMETVFTSMDATTVLTSGVAEVPTGSGSIPTAGPLLLEKGKETMVESKTPKKKKVQEQLDIQMARQLEEEMEREAQRMNEQIARDAKIARIHAEKELQIMIDGLDRSNETIAKEDLNQLWALVKESLNIRPASSDKEIELWVELKILYEPNVEDQLWTHTQNTMHAPVEWKLYDSCGVHHVTCKDNEIFMLIEKDYPMRKGLAIVMISYKLQVENYSQMENDLIMKIYKIASSPRQQGD
nr:putative ribonuclease H-like domain-containing protein [Tanacetum cinerariifolium]